MVKYSMEISENEKGGEIGRISRDDGIIASWESSHKSLGSSASVALHVMVSMESEIKRETESLRNELVLSHQTIADYQEQNETLIQSGVDDANALELVNDNE